MAATFSHLKQQSVLISILILLCLDIVLSDVVWEAKEYSNPKTDLQECGRNGKQSFVCDPDGLIAGKDADEIDILMVKLQNATGGCMCGKDCPTKKVYKGVQGGIALAQKIKVPSKTKKPTAAEKKKAANDFAVALRDKYWNYGRCNDSFVILVVAEDKEVAVVVGDKLKKSLTSSCIDSVLKENKKYFKDKKWAKGIQKMLESYKSVYKKTHSCTKAVSKWVIIVIVIVIIAILVLVCVCIVIRKKYGSFRCPGAE